MGIRLSCTTDGGDPLQYSTGGACQELTVCCSFDMRRCRSPVLMCAIRDSASCFSVILEHA